MTDAADPTELAGVAEAGTEAVQAWSLDDAEEDYPLTGSWEDPDRPQRLTPKRITVLAVAASIAILGVTAGVVVWQLHKERPVSTTHIVVAIETTTTVVPEPPKPGPPVTATPTVKALPAPRTSTSEPLPARQFSATDRAFISRLVNDGWHITSADAMVTNAHVVCTLLHQGASLESVNNRMANDARLDMTAAAMFTAAAMQIYPDCP